MITYINGLVRRLRDGLQSSSSYPYRKITYSQEGEDLILQEILPSELKGFYVDVGAHHPFKHSNTYLLYRKGWSGVNIEAMPGSKILFDKFRPRDFNVEAILSFEKSDLNTIDDEEASIKRTKGFKFIDMVPVETITLQDVLVRCNVKSIDLLNIDVEGHELDVLMRLDWRLYRPKYIMIEVLRQYDLEKLSIQSPEIKFLCDLGYTPRAKTSRTVLLQYER